MAQKLNKSKITSWVIPSFDDFEIPSPPTQKKCKRSKESGNAAFGKQFQQSGSALWVDVYAPTTKDDLAVHKKKVQEVESWLVESIAGMKGRRFLLLSGPPGCGKSATVRILSKEASLNLVEWINPTSSKYDSFMDQDNTWIPGDTVVPQSQTDVFKEFFIRTSKYRSVCDASKNGNLVLVEDFPNVFLRDPALFHSLLRHYLQRGTSPVLFIVTDSTNQQSNVKHLFPPDIQQELSIVNIPFNAIASSILLKALNRIVSMRNLYEGAKGQPQPTRQALECLAEASGGDIRSAVNALQFAVKKDVYQLKELFASSQKGSSKTKSRNKSSGRKCTPAKVHNNEAENSLAIVGGKDASLFLFRALGKILYCKRDHEKGILEPLPKNLKLHERSPLLENAEDIYDKTAMGASSFSSFLHQNMLSFYSDITSVGQALQYLTDSDILDGEWLGRNVLEDYAASITIRGLMHANKVSSSGGGWRAFNKPQWFSVRKQHQQHLHSLKREHIMSSVTSEELTTIIVPLKAKIYSAQGKGTFTLTRELGLFSKPQLNTSIDRLGEQDANTTGSITEDDLCESMPTNVTISVPIPTEQLSFDSETFDDPDEDFRIDEYYSDD